MTIRYEVEQMVAITQKNTINYKYQTNAAGANWTSAQHWLKVYTYLKMS